jgi:phospholipid N-methyltransferase
VFTDKIARGLSPGARGLVFERDQALRERLEGTYPNLEFHSDALDMAGIVESSGDGGVDAIICSLPFANFPRETRTRLAQDIYRVLRPNGRLIAVQYSTQMRRAFRSIFQDVSISFVPLNFPPAFVYTCTKRA